MKLKKGGGSTSPEWWVNIKQNGGSTCSGIYTTLRTIAESHIKEAPVNEILMGAFGYCLLTDAWLIAALGDRYLPIPSTNPLFSYKTYRCIFAVMDDKDKAATMRSHIEACKESGLTVSTFCLRHQIKHPFYYYWQKNCNLSRQVNL